MMVLDLILRMFIVFSVLQFCFLKFVMFFMRILYLLGV